MLGCSVGICPRLDWAKLPRREVKMSMNKAQRTWMAAAAALYVCMAWGCASAPAPKFEERYRLFFAKSLPVTVKPGDSAETISQAFAPSVAVNRALEEFTQQGFKLEEIKPIEWGEGATLLTFRKRLKNEETPLRAPINFVGVYRVNDNKPEPTYYVLTQGKDSYEVHITGGSDPKTIHAEWEGRELVWNDDHGKNNLRLTPDGKTLYHVARNPVGFDVPHEYTIMTAGRVVPQQQPDSDAARDARRYVIRLKPATARYYDPYPW